MENEKVICNDCDEPAILVYTQVIDCIHTPHSIQGCISRDVYSDVLATDCCESTEFIHEERAE